MAERIGIVTGVEQNGWARVAIQRSGGCGSCASNLRDKINSPAAAAQGGGHSCANSAVMESRAANPVGARSGDMVRVHMDSANLLKGALAIYVVPIVLMLLGALAAAWAAGVLGWVANGAAIAGSLIGLFAGLALIVRLDRSGRIGRKWTPTIKQVIDPLETIAMRTDRSECGH
jgi:sigma-E factor negative regulatory protein RseC